MAPPKKYKISTYDENTGMKTGVTTYKKAGTTAAGRTLYKESYKPVSNRKAVKGAMSASSLGKGAKRGGGVKAGKSVGKPVHSASCGVNQSCK